MNVSSSVSICLLVAMNAYSQSPLFPNHTEVGDPSLKGIVRYDADRRSYRITGSGDNIWGNRDAFTFAWRTIRGDAVLRAHVRFEGAGKNAHRKAGVMIRSGLGADAPYVDALLHGDGLISLQFRRTTGGETEEVQSVLRGPSTLILERTGDQATLTVLPEDGKSHPAGTLSVPLPGELHAGLVVCSHDSTVSETADFTEVEFTEYPAVALDARIVESTLETLDIQTGLRSIVFRSRDHFEAPNWSRDGRQYYYNQDGKLYTLPVLGGSPASLPTDSANKCNNDHGLSPDGTLLAVSHHGTDGKSRIFILPAQGGVPRLVTPDGPSYWHGWSPDGKTLAYCAERNGEFDVYTIPVMGGAEQRLTTAPGLDDGPDYSPDGKWIYFNSVRTGQMKIWRMNADGANQTQVTPDDNYGDWFPHPSPDGTWLVFVSYDKSVEGHPANKDVVIRLMPMSGGEPKVLAKLFGGQGTMNVPSWSPDSKSIAFVSYRLVAPK